MIDAWWRTDHQPTLVQECCEVVRQSRTLPNGAKAVATPASVFLLYTLQWSHKYPSIIVDLDNEQHQSRIMCLLQTISSMSTSERRLLVDRTSPEYTRRLYEYYLARERYSDVTFNTANCKERIWPVVHTLVRGWNDHSKFVRGEDGIRIVERWRLRTILEASHAGRDWMRWTRETLNHTTLVNSLMRFTCTESSPRGP